MVRTEDGGIACICHEHRPECDCLAKEAKPHWQPLLGMLIARAREIPNRLYGVTINHEGDAI